MKAVLILSGGADSSTLAYWLKANGYNDLVCVTFNYGQKQISEIESAKTIAKNLNAVHHIVDAMFIQKILSHSSSSLINQQIAVPHGEYTKENMQSTVVPNRNAVFLSLAWMIACNEKADVVAYGAHNGDHYLYADTRPDFFESINHSLRLGTEDVRKENLKLIAPFINMHKSEIIQEGIKLGVPFINTWTCYDRVDIHCGLCGACQERKKGFKNAGVTDPTIYKD